MSDKDYEFISNDKSSFFRPNENLKEIVNGKKVLRLPKNVVDNLVKKSYGVYGHSAVQICGWTKKSLTGKGVCYKQKFYGIEAHNCMEMSPAAMWCQQNCTFCWRPMEFMKNIEIPEDEVDEPEIIIENLKKERDKLLTGFKGNENTDLEKFNSTFRKNPSHYAISLSGEPTMYPKLPQMVKYLKSLPETRSIFIVTNGQETKFFEKLLNDEETQPTQLYISIDAPNEKLFDKINISLYKNGFNILKENLKLFSKLNCRKVFRYTQIKGLNDLDEHLEGYKELIEIGKPDFIEIKAYMHLGMSQGRHTREQMPEFTEVIDFAKKLSQFLQNYDLIDFAPNSRICLLRRKDSKYSQILEKINNK
jgi:tRNA wybutosine-synthesizing protein 1